MGAAADESEVDQNVEQFEEEQVEEGHDAMEGMEH